MTELMDQAIEVLRRVPQEHQDELARAVMLLAGKDQGIYELTPEEAADLIESDAAAGRGEFASDDEVRAIWAKHGL